MSVMRSLEQFIKRYPVCGAAGGLDFDPLPFRKPPCLGSGYSEFSSSIRIGYGSQSLACETPTLVISMATGETPAGKLPLLSFLCSLQRVHFIKWCILLLALSLLSDGAHAWTSDARNPQLRLQNVFGLTGSAWQSTGNYYVPGTGNPAVSTADYYHQNGMAWMRPYDLTASPCGSAGATIAAGKGRYVWISSADHPGGNYDWSGGSGFRLGFSNDPGVLPASMQLFYPEWSVSSTVSIAIRW